MPWLRADPRRLLALLTVGMAVPLALLVAFLPGPEETAPVPVFEPLPDFAAIGDVRSKKQAFFGYLLPMIEAHNERIRGTRAFLMEVRETLAEGDDPGRTEQERLAKLAKRYRVPLEEDTPMDLAFVDQLLRRADVLPPSLVLAQAATESAWGTSRFAKTANNLFGQWCFTKGCGIVPARRIAGATHEVQDFESVYDSVDSYFRNLNSHPAYGGVRERRLAARKAGKGIRGAELARGLIRYSERGEEYVEELRQIIRVNKLDAYDLPATPPSMAGL